MWNIEDEAKNCNDSMIQTINNKIMSYEQENYYSSINLQEVIII